MSGNNQIQAATISPLPLREASEKAVSALACLLEHGKNAPWQAWEKALNANTSLRQSLAVIDSGRHDAPDDVEVTYLIWSFQGHGSWTDATKEQYDRAKPDDRMAVVSLEDYLSKEKRTHPAPAAPQADELRAKGWVRFDCPVCGSDGAVAERPQAAALLAADSRTRGGPSCSACGDVATHYAGEDETDLPGAYCDKCGPRATRPAPAEPQAVDAEWLERREQAAYEAGKQAVAQWQPIETAPKDGTAILVTDSFAYRSDPKKTLHHIYRAVYWDDESGWVIYNDGEIIDEDGPTYWMPLPAEPGATLSASPAAPAEREPMTEHQIMSMAKDAGFNLEPTANFLYTVRGNAAQVINLIRLCEAAHHIGKPKDVGINGLTESETAASASVMGLTGKSQEPSP